MSDRVFLDTNIVVYAYSSTEIEKQAIARNLILESNSVVSTQVLQELSNTLIKKFKLNAGTTENLILETAANNLVHQNSISTILEAYRIYSRYQYSFYDSLIIAAAIEANCQILYSEDLQNGQRINDMLQILNPFKWGAIFDP